MDKRESFPRITGKKALFLVVLVFAWLGLAHANNNGLNIFQDRDQDGLSDSEEMAYGTDPDNEDSDGDGYSDGAEVRSGYNPLKPAPGDRIVIEKEPEQPKVAGSSDENNNGENLTDLFIEKIQEEKGGEIDVLQQFSQNPEEFTDLDEFEKLSEISLTKQDIETILQDSLSGQLEQDQLEMLDESEIVVLEKPTGKDDEEIKKKEKEQIEQYFTAVGYVSLSHSPVEIENENELDTKAIDFINQLAIYVQQGNTEEMDNLRQDGQEMFDETKEIPVPEVLKDVHLTGLSVLNYVLKIDPEDLANSNDPINQILIIGKVQAALSELENMQEQVINILDEYGIDAFLPKGYEEEDSENSSESNVETEGSTSDNQEINEEENN